MITAGLCFTTNQWKKRPAIKSSRVLGVNDVQQCGQHVHGGNHVFAVHHAGAGYSRPAHHPWRVRAVVVQLRFGERQRHAVIRKEHHHCVVGFATGLKRLEYFPHAVIRPPHTRVIQGKLLAHLGIIEQETGYGHLVGGKDARRHVRILATSFDNAPKRLVRIGDIDREAERFPRRLGLRNAVSSGDAVRSRILDVRPRAIRQGVEVDVPSVRLIRRGMADLAADAREIAGLLHQVHQVRPTGIPDLIKTLNLVVVRDQPGEHDITTGHAVAHRHVRMRKTQALPGQAIDVRRGAGQLAAKGADRVRTHVIHRDDQNIHRGGMQ